MTLHLIWLIIVAISILSAFGFKIQLNMSLPLNDVSLFQSSPLLRSLKYSLPTMTICMGTPIPQCFNLCPHTMLQFTILELSTSPQKTFSHSFDNLISDSYEDLAHHLQPSSKSFFRNGRITKDLLTIPNILLVAKTKIFFLLIDSYRAEIPPVSFDGFLGLGKYYDSYNTFYRKDFSFIDYLHNATTISQKIFALSYTSTSGEISFGEDYGNYSKCLSTKDEKIDPYWSCMLNQLIIGNQSIDLINKDVLFDSTSSLIQLPNEMNTTLMTNIIFPLTQGLCHSEKDLNTLIMICEESVPIRDLPSLLFKIENDVDLYISWDNLLHLTEYQGKKSYISKLVIDVNEIKNLVVGYPAFINNRIIFNKEDYSIGIIKMKPEESKRVNKGEKKIFALTIMLLLGWSCVFIFILKKEMIVNLA